MEKQSGFFSQLVIILLLLGVLGSLITFGVLFFTIGKVKINLSGLPGQEPDRGIVVNGTGKVKAVPDVAVFIATVKEEGATVAVVQDKGTKKMNEITRVMKSEGIEDKDLKTVNYSLNPKYKYDANYNRTIDGYTLTQGLQVKVRKTDKAGDLLTKATTAGANEVSSLSFTIDEPEKLEDQAREKAVADASARAELMVKAANQKLGKIIAISEVTTSNNYTPEKSAVAMEATAGGENREAPEIKTGEQEISKSVTVRFEIQ